MKLSESAKNDLRRAIFVVSCQWCLYALFFLAVVWAWIPQAKAGGPMPTDVGVPADKAVQEYDGKKVLALYEKELGIYKIPGQDDQRVKQYVIDTFQNDDEYLNDGWCSGFVSFILKEAGYEYSPENTEYGWSFASHVVEDPQPGDLAMLDGHIAFFGGKMVNSEGKEVVALYGGNQDYQVCHMWVEKELIRFYARPNVPPTGWAPVKHLPNGQSQVGLTFDDHVAGSSDWTNSVVHHAKNQHPL